MFDGDQLIRAFWRAFDGLRLAMLLGALSSSCRSSAVDDRARTPVEQGQPAAVSSPSVANATGAPNPPGPPSAVNLSCREVSACADRCAAGCPNDIRKIGCLLTCTNDCRAKGCDSAQSLFDGLTDCIQKSCFFACMGGPSVGCKSCTQEDCAEEAKRCQAHHCEPSSARDGG